MNHAHYQQAFFVHYPVEDNVIALSNTAVSRHNFITFSPYAGADREVHASVFQFFAMSVCCIGVVFDDVFVYSLKVPDDVFGKK